MLGEIAIPGVVMVRDVSVGGGIFMEVLVGDGVVGDDDDDVIM